MTDKTAITSNQQLLQRLRTSARIRRDNDGDDSYTAALHDAAANEIERLRAAIEKARGEFRDLRHHIEAAEQALSGDSSAHETKKDGPGNRSVILNGYQLKAALEFVAPDNDPDQMETEVSIQWGDAGHSGPAYYCCLTEYPDEGSIPLDEKHEPHVQETTVELRLAAFDELVSMPDDPCTCHVIWPCPLHDSAQNGSTESK